MKILITNDDGIKCPNLKVLTESVKKYYPNAEILVCAPTVEQSAVSHKINIFGKIELTVEDDILPGVKTYSIDSTPADCVKFAYLQLKYDFDLLFSGINDGINLGEDIVYSGTVSAAGEAMFLKKKSVAVSCLRHQIEGFNEGFDIFMKDYLTNDIYNKSICWNVNFPPNPKGIKFAYQGWNKYIYWFEDLGNNMFQPMATKTFKETEGVLDTDLDCFHNGYITVTPITVDMTDYKVLDDILNK